MKKILKILILTVVVLLIYLGVTTYPKLDLISGFAAKSVASCHFIDNRDLDLIAKTDNNIELIDLATNSIDESEKSASASVYGLKNRKAIYRDGLGATLIDDDFDVTKPFNIPHRIKTDNKLAFPFGDAEQKDTVFSNVDYKKLAIAVDNAFDKENQNIKNSRAVLVVYKNKIIAEKYGMGCNKNSKILGWSMTKSITATIFGILQKQNKFDIYKPAPILEWKNDSRKNITTNDLLHMNSGLQWDEDYTKISDATKMLFLSRDMAKVQLEKPAVAKPNEKWNYSSGTTNLLSAILRQQFKTHQEYLDFWYTSLIDKIGMQSMLIETDMIGNYVGSSYGWATTRDWAKFGLLYLNKGNWNGQQIFDESWVQYVTTPTKGSNGDYGGHFWLNAGKHYPDAPTDLYTCSGFKGQKIIIIPSKDIVIVRMGLKEEKQGFDFNGLIKGVISSVK